MGRRRGKGQKQKQGKGSAPAAPPAAMASRALAQKHGKKKGRGKQPFSLSRAGKGSVSSLQQAMRQRLEGSRFRMLNEMLYTTSGAEAFEKFSAEPELFDAYHRGFREQVEHWPANPLDAIIRAVRKLGGKKVVADFGCGDARLAASVPNVVHSFDLVSRNERVTACDIANVPLADGSVDVAVFCLALMGVNITDFLREANRVLRPNGLLKVAEVRSRFEAAEGDGGDAEGAAPADLMGRFQRTLRGCGFKVVKVDKSNRMFFLLDARKVSDETADAAAFSAKPCIYKRR